MGHLDAGHVDEVPSDQNGPYYISVSPDYFKVMGRDSSRRAPLHRGRRRRKRSGRGRERDDGASDLEGRVAVRDVHSLGGGPCAQVVGIVEDVRDTRGGGLPPLRYYLPLAQRDDSAEAVVMRTPPAEGRGARGDAQDDDPDRRSVRRSR